MPDPSFGPRPARPRSAPTDPRRRILAVLLAMACVAGVIGIASWLGGAPRLWRMQRGEDTEFEVREAAARLARHEPGLFADFEPFSREELERGKAPASDVSPNGVGKAGVEKAARAAAGPRPVFPRERVISTTPTFLWHPVVGATRYVLTLRDEDGQVVWTGPVAAAELPWPEGLAPLERGMPMTWEVVVEGASEPGTPTRFSAAPERDAIHWKRRVERLAEVLQDERVRAVFVAQLALRRGHVGESWNAIRGHRARFPHDTYGAALEAFLRRVHGFP